MYKNVLIDGFTMSWALNDKELTCGKIMEVSEHLIGLKELTKTLLKEQCDTARVVSRFHIRDRGVEEVAKD